MSHALGKREINPSASACSEIGCRLRKGDRHGQYGVH